jgi:hypothetical protein
MGAERAHLKTPPGGSRAAGSGVASGRPAIVISGRFRHAASAAIAARTLMARDHNPVPGQWYESLEDEETFQVLSVDEDSELIELQYEDGDVEEIDYETWQEFDLDLTEEPEGWSGSDDEDDEDDDLDDADDDDDEDEDEDYGDRDDY